MSLNSTPIGERVHIAIFGNRNVGKSSLINALTNQDIAIVSDIKGTTTDPVQKSMELLPIGPVVIIDTPGLDDTGTLGAQRVLKSIDVLNRTDIALFVTTNSFLDDTEEKLLNAIKEKNIPYLIILNKIDMLELDDRTQYVNNLKNKAGKNILAVSTLSSEGIHTLKTELSKLAPEHLNNPPIVSDLITSDDVVVLVVPIDESAPKGRLILPQQQTIREILDVGATAIVTKDDGLAKTLSSLSKKPKLIITDSQVFKKVYEMTPKDVFLTSFSILFARHKGNLDELVNGAKAINNLKDMDKILIAEGCTHHRQCNDIGTVKIPNMLTKKTGKKLIFETCSGLSYPKDIEKYALIIHCGGCTLNLKEMKHRIEIAKLSNIPIVNYGVLMAYLQDILEKNIEIFG